MSQPGRAFVAEKTPIRAWAVPTASIMAGSLVTIIPVIATFPLLPPFGLLLLLGWRMLRPGTIRVWAPVPFGFFDDLVSGQPLGSAILLWTIGVLIVDLLDQRLLSRDFWQEWLLSSGAIAFALLGGRLLATPLEAHVDTLLVFQVAASILLYPVVSHIVAWLDTKRGAP